MPGPLSGIKIVELAGIGPSPYACMLLADAGADIIRLERAAGGAKPDDPWYDVSARSRPSVGVDLKHPEGKALALELIASADAVIEGYRPGVAERLGLGPEDCWAVNPRIVYGRMTGWGQEGPLSQRAGHDINYISIAGALWPIGRAGEMWQDERGTNMLDTGAHFYEVYETKDGGYMAVGAIERQFYAELLKGLELNPDDLPPQQDRSQWLAMKERFAEIFKTKTRDEWTLIFEDTDACTTPVLSPAEAHEYAHNNERGAFQTIGGALQPSPAPRFSRTPGEITSQGAPPGAHTNAGLSKWGVSTDRLTELHLIRAIV